MLKTFKGFKPFYRKAGEGLQGFHVILKQMKYLYNLI